MLYNRTSKCSCYLRKFSPSFRAQHPGDTGDTLDKIDPGGQLQGLLITYIHSNVHTTNCIFINKLAWEPISAWKPEFLNKSTKLRTFPWIHRIPQSKRSANLRNKQTYGSVL